MGAQLPLDRQAAGSLQDGSRRLPLRRPAGRLLQHAFRRDEGDDRSKPLAALGDLAIDGLRKGRQSRRVQVPKRAPESMLRLY